MNNTQDLSIISLVIHASLLAQAVMALLLLLSLLSWTFIFRKWFAIRRARAQTERFERDFWSGGDLQALYQSAANNRHTIGALERIFESGMREFLKGKERRITDPGAILDGSRRASRPSCCRSDIECYAFSPPVNPMVRASRPSSKAVRRGSPSTSTR